MARSMGGPVTGAPDWRQTWVITAWVTRPTGRAGLEGHPDWAGSRGSRRRAPPGQAGRVTWPQLAGLVVLGYLAGSIPTGYLVARARGIDIRSVGSGNIGATNVFRILGKGPGVFVLLADALKGALAVILLLAVGSDYNLLLISRFKEEIGAGLNTGIIRAMASTGAVVTAADLAFAVILLPRWLGGDAADARQQAALIAGVCAVLGHNFTCWLRFKGGKGIATSAGVLAAWAPLPFVATLGVFGVVLAASRYVSLASILAAAALPFAQAFLPPRQRSLVWISAVLSVLAIARHHANLRRLMAGTERRLGQATDGNAVEGKGTP